MHVRALFLCSPLDVFITFTSVQGRPLAAERPKAGGPLLFTQNSPLFLSQVLPQGIVERTGQGGVREGGVSDFSREDGAFAVSCFALSAGGSSSCSGAGGHPEEQTALPYRMPSRSRSYGAHCVLQVPEARACQPHLHLHLHLSLRLPWALLLLCRPAPPCHR